jgi:ribulose-phosphate 3-epimerase
VSDAQGNPWPKLNDGPLIAPSLLACDFARLGEEVDSVIAAGAELLHVDVMDGHFVPNLSMGPPVVASLRGYTDHPLDVHIMVSDPAYYVERFADAGADSITFHVEATGDAPRLIRRLRDLGLGVGVTLRPGTPAEALADVASDVDMVLVMTVEPGFGGQEFREDMLAKIGDVRRLLRTDQRLQVDGGINPVTARQCAERGADVFVAGSSIFRSGDVARAVRELRPGAEYYRAGRDTQA